MSGATRSLTGASQQRWMPSCGTMRRTAIKRSNRIIERNQRSPKRNEGGVDADLIKSLRWDQEWQRYRLLVYGCYWNVETIDPLKHPGGDDLLWLAISNDMAILHGNDPVCKTAGVVDIVLTITTVLSRISAIVRSDFINSLAKYISRLLSGSSSRR